MTNTPNSNEPFPPTVYLLDGRLTQNFNGQTIVTGMWTTTKPDNGHFAEYVPVVKEPS